MPALLSRLVFFLFMSSGPFALAGGEWSGRDWRVCAEPAPDCDFSGPRGLQRAVDKAQSGDTLRLGAGIHRPRGSRDVNFTDLVVRAAVVVADKRLRIVGDDGAILEGRAGEPASAVAVVDGELALSGLLLRGFHYGEKEDDIYDGHGVFVIDSLASLDGVDIQGLPKMALSIRGHSAVTASNLKVSDGHIGVWIEEAATLRLTDSQFVGNDSAGVAAYQQSRVWITASLFERNEDDGVYAADAARVVISDSTVAANTPYGLRADDRARITIDRSLLEGNAAATHSATDDAAVVVGAAMRGAAASAGGDSQHPESRPALAVIAPGEFTMGLGAAEAHALGEPDQQPARRVSLSRPFAMGRHEVTRAEFGRFVEATGHVASAPCNALEGTKWVLDANRDWRQPGYAQEETHPVVCVSWDDATAYVDWLSAHTGHVYRLPSEAEWEYAARAGAKLDAPGNAVSRSRGNHGTRECCGPLRDGDDVWDYTAPVGSLRANAFGLFDTQGNVWEWVADCYHDSYAGAPRDGGARREGCSLPDRRVVRGGSWGDDSYYLSPAYRLRAPKDFGYFTLGFRVVRELGERASDRTQMGSGANRSARAGEAGG